MSGAKVSYQLRPNKYVERQLFVELLTYLGKFLDIHNYLYISMGGRLLEDFKLVHSRLNLSRMMSIEGDNITYGRQQFNLPLEHINCEMMESRTLVENFEEYTANYGESGVIVWLDYAAAKKRGQQLSEFSTLVSKLRKFDVVKITLNASLKSLLAVSDDLENEGKSLCELSVQEKGFRKLQKQLGDLLDGELTVADLTSAMLPVILADSVRRAAVAGNESDRSTFVEPLAVFLYNDGYHDMLTITSILLPYDLLSTSHPGDMDNEARAHAVTERFRSKTRLDTWPFLASDWPDVHRILIPDLSVKERLKIHEDLRSNKGKLTAVSKALPFRVGDDKEDLTEEAVEMYAKFYRYYPNFLPVLL
jgi:hypothetical protein